MLTRVRMALRATGMAAIGLCLAVPLATAGGPAPARESLIPDIYAAKADSPDQWLLKVDPSDKQDRDQEEVARALTAARLIAPDFRIKHFADFYRADTQVSCRIEGWSGMVHRIEGAKRGGKIVTLRVKPKLEDMIIDPYYILERYYVGKNGVRFLGASASRANVPRAVIGV